MEFLFLCVSEIIKSVQCKKVSLVPFTNLENFYMKFLESYHEDFFIKCHHQIITQNLYTHHEENDIATL